MGSSLGERPACSIDSEATVSQSVGAIRILNETEFMYQPACIRKLKSEELYQSLSTEILWALFCARFCAGRCEVGSCDEQYRAPFWPFYSLFMRENRYNSKVPGESSKHGFRIQREVRSCLVDLLKCRRPGNRRSEKSSAIFKNLTEHAIGEARGFQPGRPKFKSQFCAALAVIITLPASVCSSVKWG